MKLTLTTVLAASMTLCFEPPARAESQVALELVLAVDASSSVDQREYQLQISGYAKAFQDDDVILAIEALSPKGIAVTYVEWSSRFRQIQSVGWTHVFDRASAAAFGQAILNNANQLPASGTAIGEAVIYSSELFDNNGFTGDRRAIDVSADDRYNAGSTPSYARGVALAKNITINGLAVDATGELTAYFQNNVIGGPGSFVITATSFDDFETAIKKKLLRELPDQQRIAANDVDGDRN